MHISTILYSRYIRCITHAMYCMVAIYFIRFYIYLYLYIWKCTYIYFEAYKAYITFRIHDGIFLQLFIIEMNIIIIEGMCEKELR